MTITELKQKKQNMYSTIFEDLGVFFAFGNEQLQEGLDNLKQKGLLLEGEKLAPIGAGGFLPSKNMTDFKNELAKVEKWYKYQIKDLKEGKKSLILHELRNYECFYSNDISDTFEVLLPLGITKKEIEKVYNEYRNREEL